jgi:hypothetical protein
MNEFRLLTKDKEAINTVKCNSFEEAVEYFAEKKKLPITDLIGIFSVEKFDESLSGGTSRR